jgi:predicted nucleic acid-binding Zn ribbon protein
MPASYHYYCQECNALLEGWRAHCVSEEEDVPEECPHCKGDAFRTMRGIVPGLQFKGAGWPDKDRKIDKHMQWVEQVQSEPVCASEMDEGKHMLRERESDKGYPEGYLTGERPKEKVLVEKTTETVIDKNVLVDKLSPHMGRDKAYQKASEAIDKGKAHGDFVEVTRTKKSQGPEVMKQRAKDQKAQRQRQSGS